MSPSSILQDREAPFLPELEDLSKPSCPKPQVFLSFASQSRPDMDLGDQSGASYARNHRQPLVFQKLGSRFLQFGKVDAVSLGSRYIGKVLVDCKFRFAESQWGILGPSKTPAGVIYIDLGFHQPKEYRLASATVQISLQEREKPSSKKTGKEKVADVASPLAVTDQFGPKMLTGKPTTASGKTSYSLTPKVGAMGVSVGGIGLNRDKTVTYSSQWVVKGYQVPGDLQDGVPGGPTYRTLKWELSESDLSSPLAHSNVVHTGLAFTHDAKPFYIRVEIEGRLRRLSDRLRFAFPPRTHRDQGTSLTLLHLDSGHKTGSPLDSLARHLEDSMAQKNLRATPRELPDSLPAASGETKKASDLTGGSDMTNRAPEAVPGRPSDRPSTLGPSTDPIQPSIMIVERLSEALSNFPIAEKSEGAKEIGSSLVTALPKEVPTKPQDILRKDAEIMMVEERLRRLSAYPSVVMLLHAISVLLDLFGSGRRDPKVGNSIRHG